MRSGIVRGLTITLTLCVRWAIGAPTAAPSTEHLEFFESQIRPLFAEHCFECHSEKAQKLRGGLRLDSPDALLRGGTSGPAIVPGDPESSLLIKAVRYTDLKLRMPPKNKKLTPDQIASLELWVKTGAPLPRSGSRGSSPGDLAWARARHWAFQEVRKPMPPLVKEVGWVQTPVDNFVLALLEKNRLKPAPPADRRVLIRRASYDLLGLPPTPEEVESFLADPRPDAYARLVDRLLASPRYGERWGRYWLDVARYADTKGYLAGGEERRYAFSYTYRDYVIRAFNEDKPYDQFLTEQIAADQLPLGQDKRPLAALGFLTLGRRFLNNQNDIIDDRIDVVTRGTLGLTVTCARCHDHKFDPISSRDYYALHGVFASSLEPAELPLLTDLPDTPEYQDFLKQKAKLQKEIDEFKRQQVQKFLGELRQHVGDYLLGAHEAGMLKETATFDTFAGEHKLNPVVLRRWVAELRNRSESAEAVFGPWLRLASAGDAEAESAKIVAGLRADPAFNPIIVKALGGATNKSLPEVARVYTRAFQQIDADWNAAVAAAAEAHASPPASLPEPASEVLRRFLYDDNAPVNLPEAQAESILAQPISDGTAPLRNKIEALNWTHAGAPLRAMALVDRPNPGNSHVLLRGNPGTPGEEVPRRFLEALSPQTCIPFTNGSGRLDLARAIASRDNPLTARVYVNRMWLHHFGEGLVKTPGDFGVRTEEPAHRLLLDYLAASLVEDGWSTKALHRRILLSATYQQSCEPSAESVRLDPENNFYSHVNRQRLDFEALRDTLLTVAGKLDTSLGGLPVDIISEPFSTRRSVYALVDRQNLPGVFRTFDFSNPDTSSQRRFTTTVPQQALFLLNGPFVIEQARNLVQRPEVRNTRKCSESIEALYQIVFQRKPAAGELVLGERFIADQNSPSAGLTPLEKYAQVLLLSNELTFID